MAVTTHHFFVFYLFFSLTSYYIQTVGAGWPNLRNGLLSEDERIDLTGIRSRVRRQAGTSGDAGVADTNCTGCMLPDCYCQRQQLDIPGDLLLRHTPQIVTFTYTGPITESIRGKINDIFPSKRKNPNGCPIGITLFVRGTFTEACVLHEIYIRGHEIAVQSKNLSHPGKWSAEMWNSQVADFRYNLSKKAFIPLDHIQGVRAPMNEPGGDTQFKMLMQEDFMYDSTLKSGPTDLDSLQVWPFTLEEPFEDQSCSSVNCPKDAYPAMWVAPSVRLSMETTSCTYLDECVADFGSSDEVYNLLVDNFKRNYRYNRAPFQVH